MLTVPDLVVPQPTTLGLALLAALRRARPNESREAAVPERLGPPKP